MIPEIIFIVSIYLFKTCLIDKLFQLELCWHCCYCSCCCCASSGSPTPCVNLHGNIDVRITFGKLSLSRTQMDSISFSFVCFQEFCSFYSFTILFILNEDRALRLKTDLRASCKCDSLYLMNDIEKCTLITDLFSIC